MKRRWNGPLLAGGIMLLILLVLVLVPEILPLQDPALEHESIRVGEKLLKPPFAPGEAGFLLGSDSLGRDLLSRLVYGARTTLGIAGLITLGRVLLAVPLGLLAGWRKGWIGRVTEFLSVSMGILPSLLLLILTMATLKFMVVLSLIQGSMTTLFIYYGIALMLIGVPRLADQVRQLTEIAAQLPHVEGAVAIGARPGRILLRHLLPSIQSDLLVILAAEIGWVLMMMGQAAIFGYTMGPTTMTKLEGYRTLTADVNPEWALMVGLNRPLLRTFPWTLLYPALALGMTVGSLQLLSEGLRQRFARS